MICIVFYSIELIFGASLPIAIQVVLNEFVPFALFLPSRALDPRLAVQRPRAIHVQLPVIHFPSTRLGIPPNRLDPFGEPVKDPYFAGPREEEVDNNKGKELVLGLGGE
jgi:hypothetical protein